MLTLAQQSDEIHLRWRRDAILFVHQKSSDIDWTGTRVRIFLMAVFDVLLGIREG